MSSAQADCDRGEQVVQALADQRCGAAPNADRRELRPAGWTAVARWPARCVRRRTSTAGRRRRRCASMTGSVGVGREEDRPRRRTVSPSRRPAGRAALSTARAVGQHHVDLGAQHVVDCSARSRCRTRAARVRVEVGDHADLAAIVGETLGDDRRARRSRSPPPRRAGSPAAAAPAPSAPQSPLVDAPPVDDTGRRCRPARPCGRPAGAGRRRSGRPRSCRSRAGDADDRDAAAVAVREQVVDDRAADRPRRRRPPACRCISRPGPGVDLDDRAALLLERARDVLGDQVDAGDVESDHAGGECDACRDARVDRVGDVEGDVAVALDQHRRCPPAAPTRRRSPGARARARAAESMRTRFSGNSSLRAAARIGVELRFDQLASPSSGRRRSPRPASPRAAATTRPPTTSSRCSWPGTKRSTITPLPSSRATVAGGLDRFVARHQVREHAAAVVAVVGLHHHRDADLVGGLPGVVGAARPAGPRAPARRRIRAAAWSGPCRARCPRRSRWCGRFRRSRSGAGARRSRAAPGCRR